MAGLIVRGLDVRRNRGLVYADFNVPTETRGGKFRVTDDTRIRETLPTINYLREHGAKVILMSHFGAQRKTGREVFASADRRVFVFADSSPRHFPLGFAWRVA